MLWLQPLTQGPPVVPRSGLREPGVVPTLRQFSPPSESMTLLAQWILAPEFLAQPQTMMSHPLFGRAAPRHQAIWVRSLTQVAPWFQRVLDYRYGNGSRAVVLEHPTAQALEVWTSLSRNDQLHPLVRDVFRGDGASLTSPHRWRWFQVRGSTHLEVAVEWPEFRSFWAAAQEGDGLVFTPLGWRLNDPWLTTSSFLGSIRAWDDEAYLGVDEDDHVRLIRWRIHEGEDES